MNIKTILFVSFIFLLTAYSCASREEKIELINQEVEVIKKKTDNAEMHSGVFVRGENKSNFRAYFDGKKLIYIFEDMSKGFWSGSTNLYYFSGDDLIYFTQKEVGFSGPDSKTKRSVEIEAWFEDGKILEAVKKIRGQVVDISQEEVQEILEHSEKLLEVAKAINPNLE